MAEEKPLPLSPREQEATGKIVETLGPLPPKMREQVLRETLREVDSRRFGLPSIGSHFTIGGKKLVPWIGSDGKEVKPADQLRTSSDLKDAIQQLDHHVANAKEHFDGVKALKDGLAAQIAARTKVPMPPFEEPLPGEAAWKFPANVPRSLTGIRENAAQMWAKYHGNPDSFVQRWYRLGYPTFELTGSLAAALCMTECHGLRGRDYKLPFAAFAIQMPSPSPLVLPAGDPFGVFAGRIPSPSPPAGDVRFMLIDARGDVLAFAGEDGGANPVIADPADDEDIEAWTRRNVWPAMARFVVNLCVYINSLHALPDPEGKRKPGAPASKKRDHEPVPPQRWVLGRDIKLSNGMMQAARSVVAPGAPAKARAAYRMHARWMVRGHWRNQACGKKHAERKLRWIEPFWKGPEMAEGLARLYSIVQEPKA